MKFASSIAGFVGVLGLALLGFVSGCGSDGSSGKSNQQGTAGTTTLTGGATNVGGDFPSMGGALGAGGNTGTAGAGTPGTAGATGTSNGAFGMPCTKAGDCSAGLICLPSTGTEFGGGVSNGLCTMDCSADLTSAVSTMTVCSNASATAVCLQVSDTKAYCVESCTVGPAPRGTVKCHGRHDMACTDPEMRGLGFCQPTCRGDFDCAGRVCDLSDGLCHDSIDAARKLPDGSKCDPMAMTDPCHGACVGIVEDNGVTSGGFCSGFCKLGEAGCGNSPTSSATPQAYCLFGTDPNADLDDLGFCAQLCDCNGDCKNPDFICTAVQGLSAQAGRAGACGPKNTGTGGASTGIATCTGTKADAGP